jgi:hypothetical protein
VGPGSRPASLAARGSSLPPRPGDHRRRHQQCLECWQFLWAAGLTNTILSTNGATFQITGTKLEIGPAATALQRSPEMML